MDGVGGLCSSSRGKASNLRVGVLAPRGGPCTWGGTGEKVTFRAAVADAVDEGDRRGLLGAGAVPADPAGPFDAVAAAAFVAPAVDEDAIVAVGVLREGLLPVVAVAWPLSSSWSSS